jgi:cell division control protein 45
VTQNDELRFFLLRHTSLWEAMRLSPHVCTKMELYKALGMKKLQEMLAKMGIPLAQCQQQYAFMNPNLKRRLKQSIREHAEVCQLFC